MDFDPDYLPKKDCYSIKEVAKNLGCDIDTVQYYIDKNLLKAALHTHNQSIVDLCALENDEILQSLWDFTEDVYINYRESNRPYISLNSRGNLKHRPIIDLAKLKESQIDIKNIPTFLYPDNEGLKINIESSPSDPESKLSKYFITARDSDNKRYTMFDSAMEIITPIHPFMFNVVTLEEIDRFKSKYKMEAKLNNLQELPYASKQENREQVLKIWLEENGIDQRTEITLTKNQVWDELFQISKSLFTAASTGTIKKFFQTQRCCQFKSGRRKGG